MMVLLSLSGLLILLAIAMVGASFAIRGRMVTEGVRPGDAYMYAVAGEVVAIIGWVFAAVAAATALPH